MVRECRDQHQPHQRQPHPARRKQRRKQEDVTGIEALNLTRRDRPEAVRWQRGVSFAELVERRAGEFKQSPEHHRGGDQYQRQDQLLALGP